MRRTALISSLTLSTVAVAVAALFYSTVSRQSVRFVESDYGEASRAQQAGSIDTELEKTALKTSITAVDVLRRAEGASESSTDNEPVSRTNYVDEETAREMVREEATRDIKEVYPLLIRDLDLTAIQTEALLAFLIEDLIANTRTRYSTGKGMDEHARSNRISAIIGNRKLELFLARERSRREYAEVRVMDSMLEQKGVPLTVAQRDGLLKILVDVREQVETKQPPGIEPGSMASIEYAMAQMDLYERLVLELAPAVLSAKQVEYLFERYQALSDGRAHALEHQKDAGADPTSENAPLWYPARN